MAASVSFGGLNQPFTHTTLVLILGLTDWSPSVKELMLRITSLKRRAATLGFEINPIQTAS